MSQPPAANPAPLVVAASLAGLEALLLLGYAVLELFNLDSDRLAMGLATGAFLALYAAGLAFCAWGVTRRHSWARSPIVLAQLIQLGVAWNLRGGETALVAVALAALAVVVLVGLLHPASVDALADPAEQG